MNRLRNLTESRIHFDPWAAGILSLSLLVTAYQLVVTQWIDSLYIVLTITLFGVILGLALGFSRFSRQSAAILFLLYGIVIIAWQLMVTLEHETPWLSRLNSVGGTLNLALVHLRSSEPVKSPLFFLTLMAVLFWCLGVHSGFTLVRHRHPWLTILPTGIITLIIYIYGSATSLSAGYLATYLFLALVLVARMFIKEKQVQWNKSFTQVPDLLNFDLMRVTLVITFILVLFAWLVPVGVAALPSFQEAWAKTARSWEELNVYTEKAFAALKPSARLVSGYYDDSHALGRGNSRSEDLFLVVNAPVRPSTGVRYYWKARSFDLYTNEGWSNASIETSDLNYPEIVLDVPIYDDRWKAEFAVKTHKLISTLYLPVETMWVSRPGKVVSSSIPEGSIDVTAVHADPQLRSDSTYYIESALANYSIDELRQAGIDYPSWVTDRYLQLPPTITPRTVELAEFIVKGQENPHDMASAITIWLRENIEYSYTVPRPPEDQDVVDWFLFDLQRGFCNYYATAEVILLRAVGIPARFSVGFDQGEMVTEPVEGLDMPDEDRELYRVLEKNAHSWPEVYFPEFGWVEFEPTVSQAPLVRPLNWQPAQASSSNDLDSSSIGDIEFEEEFDKRAFFLEMEFERLRTLPDEEDLASASGIGIPWQFLLLIMVAVLLFWVWRARRRQEIPPIPVMVEAGIERLGWTTPRLLKRWARQVSLPPMERAFHEINLALQRVGEPAQPYDTPLERGIKLVRKLPESAVPVQMLLREYQASVYSSEPGNWVIMMPNMRLIRKQSYLGWLRRIFSFKTRK